MVETTLEEAYGKLLLSDLFTHIWFGDWEAYETAIEQIPEELVMELPFTDHYIREETALWRDNYFQIPGEYFIPPYLSSYFGKDEKEQERARQEVLCLVGDYDKFGFYYPLEQNEFPDHFGSVTAFITAALKSEIKAHEEGDAELASQLHNFRHHIYTTYLQKGIASMMTQCENRVSDPFFKAFLTFYQQSMEDIAK
ncbi:hypothetical protein JNUCC1_00139 [Lentibacillus sp. JNUCC-1]|uniref:molecular chaperone TorD family protein n=1 Tax=Lentibacillus sp. JNUCC-1 TaxID=2654513 RepID=UPI0012E875B7|nr:molecular chaperone TorD family protein [Lentibacillus sp. JNUCC-1]MUV36337.1 hypothetical protein [Lentibacillus sp. JNUCC-1]